VKRLAPLILNVASDIFEEQLKEIRLIEDAFKREDDTTKGQIMITDVLEFHGS
jgi:hypothetical protein